ncbi:amino acid ABC transporter permease [Vagococcus hydrophili]|uniref:Amino acid ABC transporter permease n=1 Tax=Vagococcus hydrophili TaxID=2714947 RepID=A0A6G8AX38_9ENTE|nr:amino acid ABC transporter permease [Vagococcus hydrophili]QIL49515.1 amino acid ABC transporter permease [Vagococcus hydrophili]
MYMPSIDFKLLVDSIPFVLEGLPYTILISLASFMIGNLLGILLTSISLLDIPVIRTVIKVYLSFLRGTPSLVLLFILYFGMPIQLPPIQAAIICFSLTSSAFLAEIYRGAISGVDPGQWEASKALGLSYIVTMKDIIFPQALRIAIPSLGNVAMDIVKGSSLAAMITVPDIFQKAKIVGGREFDFMTMYVLVALIYWGICLVIGSLQKRLEKQFEYLT